MKREHCYECMLQCDLKTVNETMCAEIVSEIKTFQRPHHPENTQDETWWWQSHALRVILPRLERKVGKS